MILAAAIAGLSAGHSVLLGLCGLVAGVGITALGPGGVVVTIALLALSRLSPAAVAGTAIVTNVGSGVIGSAVYLRSGQLRQPGARRLTAMLTATAVVGTSVGVLANAQLHPPRSLFGALLGVCVMAVGVLLYVRGRGHAAPLAAEALAPGGVLGIGVCVAALSGLFGLGGPLVSVPLLVIVGAPILTALAAAQVQSIVIASVGTIGYAVQGDVSWSLALLIGIPELVGVVAGWRLARNLPAERLRVALAGALVLVGLYLIVRHL